MIDALEQSDLTGEWWLPELPDDKVEGTLHLSRDTWPSLRLGRPLGFQGDPPHREPPIILGFTRGSGLVTLHRCRFGGTGESSAWSHGAYHRITHTDYRADVAFIGGHLLTSQDMEFQLFRMRFARLDEWMYGRRIGVGLFDVKYPADANSDGAFKVQFLPEAGCSCRTSNATVSLVCAMNTARESETGITLRPDVYVDVHTDVPVPFFDAWENIGHELQRFFSFIIGVPVRRHSIFALTVWPPEPASIEVEAIFPVTPTSPSWSRVKWHDMLTEYRSVSSVLGQCIESWLSRDAKMRRATRAFLVARDGTHYLEQRFLELARALEVYYEIEHHGEKLMDRTCFDALVKELMAVVTRKTDSAVQTDIQSGLQGLNRPSLATKLRKLFGAQGALLPSLANNAESLATEVRKWRVALTHLTNSSDAVGENADKLHVLCELMELTLEMCLLAKLGIPREAIDAAVENRLGLRPGLTSLLGLEP